MKLTYKRRSMYITIICSLATLLTTAVPFDVNAVALPDLIDPGLSNEEYVKQRETHRAQREKEEMKQLQESFAKVAHAINEIPVAKEQLLKMLQNQNDVAAVFPKEAVPSDFDESSKQGFVQAMTSLVQFLNENPFYKKQMLEILQDQNTNTDSSKNSTNDKLSEEQIKECLKKGGAYFAKGKYTDAVECYRKAAEQGNAEAQYGLGMCYEYGFGVKEDEKEAVKWYRMAADQGDKHAQNRLTSLNNKEANGKMNFYQKGEERFSKGDYKGAVSWFIRGASEGDAWAQYSLGNCYYNGTGVRRNYEEAIKWYSKAADQGLAAAQERLTFLNSKNLPGPFNPRTYPSPYPITNPSNTGYRTFTSNNPQQAAMEQQVEWILNQNGMLSDRQKQELIERQVNEAISKDPLLQKAIEEEKKGNLTARDEYVRQSAEQGNLNAQFLMGMLCESEKNYDEARKWHSIAAQGGMVGSQVRLKELSQLEDRINAEKEEAELNYLKSIGDYSNPRFAELVAKIDARERKKEANQKYDQLKKQLQEEERIRNRNRAYDIAPDWGNRDYKEEEIKKLNDNLEWFRTHSK